MKALITGASSGIGKAVAIELAQKNIDLVLVARRQEALEQLKKSLQSYPIHIDVFPCDLKDEKNVNNLSYTLVMRKFLLIMRVLVTRVIF